MEEVKLRKSAVMPVDVRSMYRQRDCALSMEEEEGASMVAMRSKYDIGEYALHTVAAGNRWRIFVSVKSIHKHMECAEVVRMHDSQSVYLRQRSIL